jgi:uncharacterized membrane protein YkoI
VTMDYLYHHGASWALTVRNGSAIKYLHRQSGQKTGTLTSWYWLTILGFVFLLSCGTARAADAKITAEQASQIALTAVPGKVTDVAIERKRGRNVYVVEITAEKDGAEIDVLVDIESGKVVGTER